MPDEKESTSQGSSLNIEAVLRMSEQSPEIRAPQKSASRLPSRGRSRFDATKIRNGVSAFYNKRKDNPTLNVLVDILMVVFGLGATAGLLGIIVLFVRIISGAG